MLLPLNGDMSIAPTLPTSPWPKCHSATAAEERQHRCANGCHWENIVVANLLGLTSKLSDLLGRNSSNSRLHWLNPHVLFLLEPLFGYLNSEAT